MQHIQNHYRPALKVMEYVHASTKREANQEEYDVRPGTWPDVAVYGHNEQAYNLVSPRFIAFHYLKQARKDGFTRLFNMRNITGKMHPDLKQKLHEVGYTIVRNLKHCNETFQTNCWQNFFGVDEIKDIKLSLHESVKHLKDKIQVKGNNRVRDRIPLQNPTL